MVETQRVLLVGTLDYEGMRHVLQAAITAGYRVDHARPEWLSVSGNGAEMRVWKLGEALARPDLVIHQNMKVFDPLFCVLEAWERQGVLVVNSTQAGHANISKWSQQERFDELGFRILIPSWCWRLSMCIGLPSGTATRLSSSRRSARGEGGIPVGRSATSESGSSQAWTATTAYVAQQFVSFDGWRRSGTRPEGGRRRRPDRHRHGTHRRRRRIRRQSLRCGGRRRAGHLTAGGGEVCPAAAEAVAMTVCSVDYWLTGDHPKE